MDYKYIEQLLDRYFLAETTLQEEQILKSFFAQSAEEMPRELSRYAPLFAAIGEQEQLGDDFDERLLAMTEEQGTQKNPQRVKARTIKMTERLRPLFKAAAVVAILLTLGNAINQSLSKSESQWTATDEYADVKPADNGAAVAYDKVTDSLTLAQDNIPIVAISDSLMGGGRD